MMEPIVGNDGGALNMLYDVLKDSMVVDLPFGVKLLSKDEIYTLNTLMYNMYKKTC